MASASVRRRARRAGYTLIELVTYLALITTAMMTIGGIEMAATRAAFLERALVELHGAQDAIMSAFEDDVAQARSVELEEHPAPPFDPAQKGLVVRRADGKVARWGTGKDARGRSAFVRVLARADGTSEPDRAFQHVERYQFTIESQRGVNSPEANSPPPPATSVANAAPFVRLDLWLAYAKGDEKTVRRRYGRVVRPLGWEAP